ncbi:MAG: hypothetical protein IT168_07315 [Bryobacterales bacterium]|nr:hypothetical protein [Bryobacterales bacterium]
MRTLTLALLLSLGAAAQQPRIARVLNSASQIPAGLPGSAVALGSIVALIGENLGPAQLVQSGFPLPTDLAGTQVRISPAGGAEVGAYLLYTSTTQVAAVVPSSVPVPATGTAVIRIIRNGQASDPVPFTIVRNSPGIYTLNSAGAGAAVLTDPSGAVLTWNNAAQPGQTVSAWVTGIGAGASPDNEPAPFFDPPVNVEVFVGGKPANVRYRGRAPTLAGLDQIVFDIPNDVRGCGVSLMIGVGGNQSNFTTISVAGPGARTCSDPNGLSTTDLANLPGGPLRMAAITLRRTRSRQTVNGISYETRTDTASATFNRYEGLAALGSISVAGISYGNCIVQTYRGEQGVADPVTAAALDPGISLSLNGPNGLRLVNRVQNGLFGGPLGQSVYANNVLQPGGVPGLPSGSGQMAFLDPGPYTITNANGGADIGAFNAQITLPTAIEWLNYDAVQTVSRNQPLTIRWTGGNPAADYVTVVGMASRNNPFVGATFACTAAAGDGQLVVPAEVLSAMPVTNTNSGVPTGSLTVYNAPVRDAARFTATGLQFGTVRYQLATTKDVAFQ